MSTEVRFYREVVDSVGKPRNLTVMTVETAGPLSDSQAVDHAKQRFCQEARVGSWRHLAHGFEIRHGA